MANHPNRAADSASRNPTAAEIAAAREAAGLTPTAAGALVHVTYRTWKQWEDGARRMHPAIWDLFCREARSADQVLVALRDLVAAVERCEDNDFSEASRAELAVVADRAAKISFRRRK
jgi:hypothetical protein